MLAAVPLINHNPVRREIWGVAWTYKQDFKVDQTSAALRCRFDVPARHLQA
jgi:hypothetical protein